MRGPKAAELMLSETERAELERLVRGHLTPQQLAVRGRMILLAAEGKGNAQIGRELHMCADTVRLWRMRWIGLQATELADLSVSGRLKDDARPGRPAEISAEQTCKIAALTCDRRPTIQRVIGQGANLPKKPSRAGSSSTFPPDMQGVC